MDGGLNRAFLVIDDDAGRRDTLVDLIQFFDVTDVRTAGGTDWRAHLEGVSPAAVFLAADTPAAAPDDVERAVPDAAVVVVGGSAPAAAHLDWPVRLDKLAALVERYSSTVHRATQLHPGHAQFIGASAASATIRDMIGRVAPSAATVS